MCVILYHNPASPPSLRHHQSFHNFHDLWSTSLNSDGAIGVVKQSAMVEQNPPGLQEIIINFAHTIQH